VATVRSESLETDPQAHERIARLVEELPSTTIDLQPFGAPQTARLLRETLPLGTRTADEAVLRSKGNPLFALQMVYAWALAGQLKLVDGRYEWTTGEPPPEAASTGELWEERIRTLPADHRLAALAASALGGEIRADVLKALHQSLGFDSTNALHHLVSAHILLPQGRDRLRWPHALLQEHLLSQLNLHERHREVFQCAADALAHHPAASNRRVVRHRISNLLRAENLHMAAHLLRSHVALQWTRTRDASTALSDLELLNPDGPGRGLIGADLAHHLRWTAEAKRHLGRLQEALREVREAIRLFEEGGDTIHLAHCLRLEGHVLSDKARPSEGRVAVERSIELFRQSGDVLGLAQAELTLAEIIFPAR
jgi:tetratricopeptide (TPR) repeat protein